MKKNNTTWYVIGGIILIVLAGFFLMRDGSGSGDGAISDNGDGELQKVVIGMKDYNYYPQEIRVKVNQPVEITLDESVGGCFRDFTIREFGVRQYSRSPQDKIIFTPTKTGTFTFACSMNMGTGRLIVE
jgi:plastocyanin domain-containing protein